MERLFALYAKILDYPQPALAELTRECEKQVPGSAVEGLREFRHLVATTPQEKLEEAYTETFDLGMERCPYVGYHLFGDGYNRSKFLQELNARYRARGFEPGSELPDHLSVMLRFLSTCEEEAEREEILQEAIEPALEKMTAISGGPTSAYDPVLRSLAAALKGI
jgi:nitrate reductase molybdenum cofactor assembly chaperone NarJ/NarW